MKALRVGTSYFVNADRIEIVQPWPSRSATRLRSQAVEAGAFFDATGGKPIASLVVLRSGWVVASPLNPLVLVRRPTILAPTRPGGRGTAPQVVEIPKRETVASSTDDPDDEDGDEVAGAESEGDLTAPAPPPADKRRSPISRLIGR